MPCNNLYLPNSNQTGTLGIRSVIAGLLFTPHELKKILIAQSAKLMIDLQHLVQMPDLKILNRQSKREQAPNPNLHPTLVIERTKVTINYQK